MSEVDCDLFESSRMLARALLQLARVFEDLYVPDDPAELINEELHDNVACALLIAHKQLTEYLDRADAMANGTDGMANKGCSLDRKKLN